MFKLLAAVPAACIAKEFGGVDGIEGGSVSQHPDTFTATHIVKVGIGADIDEEFFQRGNRDTVSLLQGGSSDEGFDDEPGLGDVYVVIEDFFVRTEENGLILHLETVEKRFSELSLRLNICERVVGQMVLERG